MENSALNYTGPRLFGAPVGDFGPFATLLVIFASTLATFFLFTFVAIMSMLFYSTFAHVKVNFANTYLYVGAPAGILMFLASTIYFGSILIRRLARRS